MPATFTSNRRLFFYKKYLFCMQTWSRDTLLVENFAVETFAEARAKFSDFCANFESIFSQWPQKYNFLGINLRTRPNNSFNCERLYPLKYEKVRNKVRREINFLVWFLIFCTKFAPLSLIVSISIGSTPFFEKKNTIFEKTKNCLYKRGVTVFDGRSCLNLFYLSFIMICL